MSTSQYEQMRAEAEQAGAAPEGLWRPVTEEGIRLLLKILERRLRDAMATGSLWRRTFETGWLPAEDSPPYAPDGSFTLVVNVDRPPVMGDKP